MDELQAAIKTVNTSNKSVDLDGTHPLMLKHMGFWARSVFLNLVNICFTNKLWPWNNAKVVFFKKTWENRL